MARVVAAAVVGIAVCELSLSIGRLLLSAQGGGAIGVPRGYLFFAPNGLPLFLATFSLNVSTRAHLGNATVACYIPLADHDQDLLACSWPLVVFPWASP